MAVAQMDLCPDIVDWIAGMVLASPYSLSEQTCLQTSWAGAFDANLRLAYGRTSDLSRRSPDVFKGVALLGERLV